MVELLRLKVFSQVPPDKISGGSPISNILHPAL